MDRVKPRAARLLVAVAALLLWVNHAEALESSAVTSRRATATLVTDSDTVQPGVPFHLGLYLRLAAGWHSYWRNPGDAGVSTDVTVQFSSDSVAGPLMWPTPERIAEGDLTTFGYRGDVLLPLQVTPGSGPLTVRAHASWLVCRDICVPEEGDFTLILPQGPPVPSAQAALFAATASRIPPAAPFQATIGSDGTLRLSGSGLPGDVIEAEFFPQGDGQTEATGAQRPVRQGNGLVLHVAIGSSPTKAPLVGVVRLTRSNGTTQPFTISASDGAPAAPAPRQSMVLLLLAALGGGLLLNLMPCVFPVLAMKAMALARLSGTGRRTVRGEAGSYTLGVVASFTALGAALLALRGAGQAVGWGFQFQSPVFVTVVAWLLFATGLNMSGVFAMGERMAGAGQSLTARRGHLGSFFTGLLAVVVATPCTASFMGAALAGALTAPPAPAMLVFATMGLGLALPYAAIAAIPGIAALLPRPGQWMVTVRQVLAFPMYAAAAWLVWVVSQQTGPTGVLTASVGLVGVGFAAWALGTAQSGRGPGRYVAYAAMVAGGLAAAAMLTVQTGPKSEASEPFSPARLAELQGQGRPVFVNMTAAWCLSCLVNERIALSPHAVRTAFDNAHVAYLKGDWTRQDPTISAFLRDHDRDGVPLYVFYAPGKPAEVLPQLLSEADLLAQIARLRS